MKKFLLFFISLFIFIPSIYALSDKYVDNVYKIVGEEIEEEKINIYLFYSDTCPHCHKEMEYLEELKNSNKNINVYTYEVTKNSDNKVLMKTVKSLYNVNGTGVPFTVIGEDYIYGFSDTHKKDLENIIDKYLNDVEEEKKFNIPLLGSVNAKGASISLIAVILGLIDGFNPCAMWILLLLINMTLSIKSRKKMFFIGFTFIITGGIVYFLSMLGIGIILDFLIINVIRDVIAGIAIILGLYNLYTYIKTRKDSGCHVVKKEKRKSIINKLNNILSKKSLLLGILGTVVLAVSVNLVELACSLGFPTVFLELLSINNIQGLSKILYLLIYIFFYLIDDMIVFLIAVFTLKQTGFSTKYNKLVNLIGGILMILMGALLIFKPEWIMLNF